MKPAVAAMALVLLCGHTSAQGKPVPTDAWYQAMIPRMTEDFCKPGHPFHRHHPPRSGDCRSKVAYYMDKCYAQTLRGRLPATLSSRRDGVNAGEKLGTCVLMLQRNENAKTGSRA
jgi:hypothetical protein